MCRRCTLISLLQRGEPTPGVSSHRTGEAPAAGRLCPATNELPHAQLVRHLANAMEQAWPSRPW
jgi:hypothetical protein